jgi:fatty acid desaturase
LSAMASLAPEIVGFAEPEEGRPPSARALLDGADLARFGQRSDRSGAVQLAAHLGCMSATGLLVWLATPFWYLLVPAMALHGFTIVTLFAPMHECVHRTAFRSPVANDVVGWLAGVGGFYNSTFYWYFHSWHHRYTQDPARDPELAFPKGSNLLGYVKEIGSVNFWVRRAIDYPALALCRVRLPFIPDTARRRIAMSMSAQLLIYLAGAVSIVMGYTAVLYFWFVPVLLAQPFLRAVLIAEHTGCSLDGDGLTNTRTTLTWLPIRLLMWNMPYHAEHHSYPAIPFHQLPAVHLKMRQSLAHIAPGYVAANRDVLRHSRESGNPETPADA